MPRAKYVISSDDFNHARFYVENQLRTFGFSLRDNVTLRDAEQELTRLMSSGSKGKHAALLNSWSEKHLTSKDWHKLKTAIRKRRERWMNHNDTKTVSISSKSHKLLAALAIRDNVTFNEVLEKYLSKALYAAKRK